MKTTLLTNIYNEEYLLPFWLEHHKKLFDHGIIVDYWSTDKSVEICKKICPTWEVKTTSNPHFGAIEIDQEFMKIESEIDGIKMHLNTTEFLFVNKPLSTFFTSPEKQISFGVEQYGIYSNLCEDLFTNFNEMLNTIVKDEIHCILETTRGHRQLHNFTHGNYGLGRHTTYNPSTITSEAKILWLGYYPWNDDIIKRKLNVKKHIPQSDRIKGYSYHHFFDINTLLNIRSSQYKKGKPIKEISSELFCFVCSSINTM